MPVGWGRWVEVGRLGPMGRRLLVGPVDWGRWVGAGGSRLVAWGRWAGTLGWGEGSAWAHALGLGRGE